MEEETIKIYALIEIVAPSTDNLEQMETDFKEVMNFAYDKYHIKVLEFREETPLKCKRAYICQIPA